VSVCALVPVCSRSSTRCSRSSSRAFRRPIWSDVVPTRSSTFPSRLSRSETSSEVGRSPMRDSRSSMRFSELLLHLSDLTGGAGVLLLLVEAVRHDQCDHGDRCGRDCPHAGHEDPTAQAAEVVDGRDSRGADSGALLAVAVRSRTVTLALDPPGALAVGFARRRILGLPLGRCAFPLGRRGTVRLPPGRVLHYWTSSPQRAEATVVHRGSYAPPIDHGRPTRPPRGTAPRPRECWASPRG
jgi:hypothetical protein